MTSLRKTISILLAVIMVCGAFAVMPLTASANSGEKSNPLITDVVSTEDTNTYYFYMPEEWRNEYNDNSTTREDACAGIYWWEGTDNCNKHPNTITGKGWPGYRVTETVAPNVFVAHVPKDVSTINWNNTVYGGADSTTDVYKAAVQTANVPSDHFSPKDIKDAYGVFPNGIESFDGMIFVCDPDNININEFSGKATYNGSWLYYYGNGEYGVAPTKEAAGEEVYSNGKFPELGFSIDKEEIYVATNDTNTIKIKRYDPNTVFSINGDPVIGTEAPTTCEILVDDPTVASITVANGVVTVKGLKEGTANIYFNYTIPGETDPETGNTISSATTITKTCKAMVFFPDETEAPTQATEPPTQAPTVCNHSTTKITTTPATYFANGKTVVTCADCGKVIKTTTIAKKVLKTPTVCNHSKTKTTGVKKATYFSKGNTGNKICKKCGKKIAAGRSIPKLVLKTPKSKIKSVGNSIVINYKKVKGAKGFVLNCKFGSQIYIKTVKTTKSKTVRLNNIKKGTKATVKIRAFTTSGKKKAYSRWTKTKTLRI